MCFFSLYIYSNRFLVNILCSDVGVLPDMLFERKPAVSLKLVRVDHKRVRNEDSRIIIPFIQRQHLDCVLFWREIVSKFVQNTQGFVMIRVTFEVLDHHLFLLLLFTARTDNALWLLRFHHMYDLIIGGLTNLLLRNKEFVLFTKKQLKNKDILYLGHKCVEAILVIIVQKIPNFIDQVNNPANSLLVFLELLS